MGEYADMMLNGTLCERCGAWVEGEALGVPRYCSRACARERRAPWPNGSTNIAKKPRMRRAPYSRKGF